MGLTEKDRFRKWEAQLQEWMLEPPSNWRDIFALRDYVRQVAKKAEHRYCAIVLKPFLCAVTEKQTLASIKSAYQYGGDFMSKIAAAALAGDPRTATACCGLSRKSSPNTDQAALSTTSTSDYA